MINGRTWAYAGAILGGLVSVAANIAHSFVPPAGAPNDWRPHTGAVVLAAFWPVALLVAIEIISRTSWPADVRWVLLRFGGLVPVAGVAGVVSYRHLSGLLAYYGEDAITTVVGPLGVDGLMVVAAGALIATAGQHALAAAVVATVNPETQPATTEATSKREHIIAALTTTAGDVAAARQLLADNGITVGREYCYRLRRTAWQPAQ